MQPSTSAARPEGGAGAAVRLDAATATDVWRRLREALGGAVAELDAATEVTADAQGRLVVSFPESQRFNLQRCQRPANMARIEAALGELVGGRAAIVLTTHADPVGEASGATAAAVPVSPRQRQADAAAEPFVQRAVELFDADAGRMRYVAPQGDE